MSVTASWSVDLTCDDIMREVCGDACVQKAEKFAGEGKLLE